MRQSILIQKGKIDSAIRIRGTMLTAISESEALHPIPFSTKSFGLPWPEFNEGLSYNDVVRPSNSATILIEFYSREYKTSAPLQGWLQRIQNGQIKVDGSVVTDPNSVLSAGSELVYHRLPWKEPDAPFLLDILYEDEDMIALNKPSGLQVLPGGLFHQRTVLTQLKWLPRKQNACSSYQESHPVPVHRLGRGTSGILLCAKTKIARTRLATYFADGTSQVREKRHNNQELGGTRKISKVYRALVSGIIDMDKVIIDQPIGAVNYPGVARGLYVASPTGKPALSTVIVLERDLQRKCTWVQVQIQSGRPHQIRIHLSFVGHPLLGDPLYISGGQPRSISSEFQDESYAKDGGYKKPTNPVPGDCGYYLHAYELVLCHPTTDEAVKIAAPLPSTLQTRKETQACCSR